MLVYKPKRALILKVRDTERITNTIPTAKVIKHKGAKLVAVPHRTDEVRVLRNLGINAPAPIRYYYKWSGQYEPFRAQRKTAEFLSTASNAFVLNDLGCVDSETEYLSPTGWVKISEYKGGRVAQYVPETGAAEFVVPQEYVKKPCPEMYKISGPGVDQMLSPEHRVLWYFRPGCGQTDRHNVTQAQILFSDRKFFSKVWLPVGDGGRERAALDRCDVSLVPSTDGFKYCFMVPSSFLILRRNGCVFASGNTGKTMSALWAYDFLRKQGLVAKALVITPLSTLERTWGDEIFMHFPHLTFAVLHGTRDKRLKLLNTDVDIYLINHDGIKTAGFLDATKLRPDINLVIVDEIAQIARNSQADRWRALNALCNKQFPRRVWGMTGTPTPNLPTDAWAQCRIINPGSVPNYFNRFRDMVMRQIGTYAWVPRENATAIVEAAMQPAIRFTRDDCVDLPPCIYQTREVELTPEQSKAYNAMLRHLKAEAESGEILAVNEAVKASKLVQIACGVAYGKNGEEVTFDSHNRLEVLNEIVESAGTKVIVFVPFVSAVQYVAEALGEKYDVAVIHGGVKKADRDTIFSGFQRGLSPQIIVAQPAAMSHGLTLTAASTIVWYAPVTSNETYEQANGRITRPGQQHTQFIINIEGTPIERKMYNRLRNKQAMQGLLLDMVASKQTA